MRVKVYTTRYRAIPVWPYHCYGPIFLLLSQCFVVSVDLVLFSEILVPPIINASKLTVYTNFDTPEEVNVSLSNDFHVWSLLFPRFDFPSSVIDLRSIMNALR